MNGTFRAKNKTTLDETSRRESVQHNFTKKSLKIAVSGGPRVVASTAAFHARVRGSFPCLGGLKKAKIFLPHPLEHSVLWGASVAQPQTVRVWISNSVSGWQCRLTNLTILARSSWPNLACIMCTKSGLKLSSFYFEYCCVDCLWRSPAKHYYWYIAFNLSSMSVINSHIVREKAVIYLKSRISLFRTKDACMTVVAVRRSVNAPLSIFFRHIWYQSPGVGGGGGEFGLEYFVNKYTEALSQEINRLIVRKTCCE